MKKVYLLFLLTLPALLTLAQEKTTVVEDAHAQVRQVSSFTGIKVSHGIQLMLSQGSTEGVAVSAGNDEYRDRIKTVVENGVLKIYYDAGGDFWKSVKTIRMRLKAYVTVKELKSLDGSSGATISIDGRLKADKLDIDLSSGSTLKGEIDATEMTVDQSSGSVARVSGSAGSITLDGSSGSAFYGYDLQADRCKAEASSGAVVEITCNKEMAARASSGGGVRYKGSAGLTNVSTSSGGSVNKRS